MDRSLRLALCSLLLTWLPACAGHERSRNDADVGASGRSDAGGAIATDADEADAGALQAALDAASNSADASTDAARADARADADTPSTSADAASSDAASSDAALPSGPARAEWHTFHGEDDHDEVAALALAADDAIYVVGRSVKSWNGPAGQPPLAPHESSSGAFVLKLSADGAYQWHGFYGGFGWGYASSAAVGPDGNLYVAGTSTEAWMAPGGKAPLNAYAGGRDIILFSLRADGGFRWHTFLGGAPERDDSTGHEEANAIAVDQSGSVYLAGEAVAGFKGPGGAAPVRGASLALGGFTSECFVLKLTPDGTYVWHTFQGGTARDACHGIDVDSQGQIFVSGTSFSPWLSNIQALHRHTNTSASLDGQQEDIFVASLNPDGRLQWHTFLGTTSLDEGGAIRVGPDSALYALSRSSASWSGPAGEPPRYDGYAARDTNLRVGAQGAEEGAYQFALTKLDKTGNYQWHARFGDSPTRPALAFEHGRALIVASADLGWNGPAGQPPRLPHAPAPPENQSYATSGVLISVDPQGAYAWHSFTGITDSVSLTSAAVDSRGQIVTAGTSSQGWNLAGRAPIHMHSGSYSDVLVMKLSTP